MPAASAGNVLFSKLVAFKEATPGTIPTLTSGGRKLLVTDIQMYSGHSTIPHGNYMIELMAKYTGAFEPTFSNALSVAIDAIFSTRDGTLPCQPMRPSARTSASTSTSTTRSSRSSSRRTWRTP